MSLCSQQMVHVKEVSHVLYVDARSSCSCLFCLLASEAALSRIGTRQRSISVSIYALKSRTCCAAGLQSHLAGNCRQLHPASATNSLELQRRPYQSLA